MPSIPAHVAYGDTAEFQTVPYILGIAHPTGFPAFTLAGWLFTHVVAFGTVAWRMNAFTALCTALTASAVVLLAAALECELFAAFAVAFAFACGPLVWHSAAYANAHALAGLCIVSALAASVAFARTGERNALFIGCASAGLGLATHPETIWVLPAIAVALLWQRIVLRPRMLFVAALLLLAPLLLYAYLPLRSTIVAAQHLDPAAAAPLFGAGNFDWDTNAPRTVDGFLNEVLGRHQYAGVMTARAFDLRTIPAAAGFWFEHAREQCNPGMLLFAALGFVALALRDRRGLSVLFAGTAGAIMFAYSYHADVEINRYFLSTFAVTAALAAAATRLPLPRLPRVDAATVVTIALAILASATYLNDRALRAQFRDGGSQATIDGAARDIPDGAIVVAFWDDAATLGYGAFVERALGARTVIAVASPEQHADEYPAWARHRRIVMLVKWGTPIDGLPAAWVHELPSSTPFYHFYEIVPN